MKTKDLKEKRAGVVSEMRALADNPHGANGDFSAEQAEKFDRLKAENEQLEKQIERQSTLDNLERRVEGSPVDKDKDSYEAELSKFSLRKALAGAGGLNVDWAREKEVGQEYAKRAGLTPQGIIVPLSFETRTTDTTLLSDVSSLKPTEHLSQSFVDKLRANVVVKGLGATMLSNLTGDVEVPTMGDSVSAEWFAEDASISLSSMTTGQVTMSPKHVGARTELSRNTLLQTSPDIEQLVQRDFAAVLARAVDLAALNGTGSDGQPTGILNRGITEVADFALTWEKIQELIGALEDEDASGSAFVTKPAAVRTMRQTNKASGEPEHGYIMENRNTLDGYPVATSTHMAAEKLLFGNFSDVLIGQWGGVEILANPYASGSYEKGNIQYRIIQTLDVQIRRSESFAFGDWST